MKLTGLAILSHVLAIGLTSAESYETLEDDSFETGSEESHRESGEDSESHEYSHSETHYEESYDDGKKEFHYTFDSCNGKEEGSCKDGTATVENVNELISKEESKEGKQREGLDEEQSKIAAMSNAEIQADAEEYIWPHEEYKEDPSGCGYPLCVLDNQTPKRMRSFCQLMKWIKDDGSNEYRPFHFQKADCINAIDEKGHDWDWGRRPRKSCDYFGRENPEFDIPLCLVDVKKAVAIHFDNPCKAMEYMAHRRESVHMYVVTGDKKHSDQCEALLKSKRTYLKTEWFDIDDPCILGDMESATQTYHYVKSYPLTETYRFCGSQFRKQEIAITTIQGQSLLDAQAEGQIIEKTLKNGGEFVCLNLDQNTKPAKPDHWFTRKIKCKDYRIQFKCACFFGCKKRKKEVKIESYRWSGWKVRVPEIPHLFSECEWNPYVNTDAQTNIGDDVETRSTMLWGRPEGADLTQEGDYGAYKEHACGNGHFDAMYIDSRRIKDSKPASETGELITKNTPFYGFLCFTKNQEDEKKPCSNYKVRFCCKRQMQAMWGEWEKWSDCSVTCGKGTKTRKRVCDNNSDSTSCVGVKDDDKRDEQGRPIQEKSTDCNKPCPTESYAVWSDWQEYSPCTVTCGVGTMKLDRRCEAKCAKKIKGVCLDDPCPSQKLKQELYFKDEECRKEACSLCAWDEWAAWSKCSATCDIGQKFRKRRCVDLNNNYRECDIGKCTRRGGSEMQPNECVENETCPVDFYWECWTNWSDCSVNCGRGGKQHRRRYCQDGHHGGKKCVKKHIEEERECSGKLGECPRNCIWKQWGSWSKCSLTCANYHGDTPPGSQTRYRKIYKPAKYGGKECHPDENKDTQSCEIKTPPCESPCEWGEWSGWTGMKCPTCFKFEREKKKCLSGGFGRRNSRYVDKEGTYCKCEDGESDCSEKDFEDKKEECDCNVPMCAKDTCTWAEWGPWGDCQSDNCDSRGRMYKKRKCMYHKTDDREEGEIVDCRDREKCRMLIEQAKKDKGAGNILGEETWNDCPNLCQHIDWTEWEDWGPCSVTCGKGTRIRSRLCNGVGKDEMIPSVIKKFCPKGSKNGREKEEERCDMGSCEGKPDCPKYDGPCLDEAKKYERRQRRKNRRNRQRRRNHRQ